MKQLVLSTDMLEVTNPKRHSPSRSKLSESHAKLCAAKCRELLDKPSPYPNMKVGE